MILLCKRLRYQVPNADSDFILFHCINFHCIWERFVHNLMFFLLLNERDILIKETRLLLLTFAQRILRIENCGKFLFCPELFLFWRIAKTPQKPQQVEPEEL